jgi:5'-nucleotidase
MSKNHPDLSLRVFNSINFHGLDISRSALTGGASLAPYFVPFQLGLFLSQSQEDVQSAANQGIAAGRIYSPPPKVDLSSGKIRIAFDGDCVIFSDEAEKIHDKHGLPAFLKHEKENARRELPGGPFAKFLRSLSEIQGPDPDNSPLRIALVTDRNTPAHERAIRTLRKWNVRLDESFFLGGIPKTGILEAFGPHMFFDDKKEYCDQAAQKVPTGHVLQPLPMSSEMEVNVSVESGINVDAQERFLLSCKSFLKRSYSGSEGELGDWFRMRVVDMSGPRLANFLEEFELSVKDVPLGSNRTASAEENSPKERLLMFLENLFSKHRLK